MSLALLLVVGGLTSVGLYLVTARSLSRIILGFTLLGHAAVVALVTAGGPPGQAPIVAAGDEQIANPLPQALALTAIVISFGLTLFLLALAGRQQELSGDDLVEDDLEDRRIAHGNIIEDHSATTDCSTGDDQRGVSDNGCAGGLSTRDRRNAEPAVTS